MSTAAPPTLDAADAKGTPAPPRSGAAFRRDAWLLGVGWFGTSLVLGLGLPFTMLLKEQLGLDAMQLASFFAVANVPVYIKPIAGLLSDAFPIFGTRRRHYLLISLLLVAAGYLMLGLVPRQFYPLLWVYLGIMCAMVLTSTVLGGYMVEVGKRQNATGRLSAQRLGVAHIVGIISGPAGGFLAGQNFLWTTGICGGLSFFMYALFYRYQREPPRNDDEDIAITSTSPLRDARRQLAMMFRTPTLWAAAGMVVLLIIAPGFGTALLYYSRDELKFSTQFLGNLGVIAALGGFFAAWSYGYVCSRVNLRTLLILGFVINGLLTLLFLWYRTPTSAMIITATESISGTWAILPLYDLAARATPRGCEALGYSLMMSVWNLTSMLSGLIGAYLYARWGLTIHELIWVNTITTLSVLIAVPLLPAVLTRRRDSDWASVP